MGAGGDLGLGMRVGLRAFGVDFTIAAIAMTQECRCFSVGTAVTSLTALLADDVHHCLMSRLI